MFSITPWGTNPMSTLASSTKKPQANDFHEVTPEQYGELHQLQVADGQQYLLSGPVTEEWVQSDHVVEVER
jgi:hypothetical protein